jgi:exodeoxyribonuclease VII large subunit
MSRFLAERRARAEGVARGLPNLRRVIEDAGQRLDDWAERMANGLRFGVERRRARLAEVAASQPSLRRPLADAEKRLAREGRSLAATIAARLREARGQLGRAAALLESCSYARILDRGFVLAYADDGRLVGAAADTAPGMDLTLHFHDGEAAATVTGGGGDLPRKRRMRRRRTSGQGGGDNRQGNLL